MHDESSALPEPREASEDALGCRGMFLVDALAETWAAYPCPQGKDVTACFRPSRPARETMTARGTRCPVPSGGLTAPTVPPHAHPSPQASGVPRGTAILAGVPASHVQTIDAPPATR